MQTDPTDADSRRRDPATPGAPQSAGAWQALVDRLPDRDRWPEAATGLLADLGFRLMDDRRSGRDDSHLLVALRDRPTLRHFDPEWVGYYAPVGDGAGLRTIDSRTSIAAGAPSDMPVLWGQVQVVDRIPVANRFLTFGGRLRLVSVDRTLTLLDLWSPAPIVRWGGHSQGTDSLTQAMGAFFARLMVPVDFQAGAEARIDATPPEVLYRAFLVDSSRRSRQAARRGFAGTDLEAWLAGALRRARANTSAFTDAVALLEYLDVVA